MRLTVGTRAQAGGGVRVAASALVGDTAAPGRSPSSAEARLGGSSQSSSLVGALTPLEAAARAGGGLSLS